MTPYLDGYVRARTSRLLAELAERQVVERAPGRRGRIRVRVGRSLVTLGAQLMGSEVRATGEQLRRAA